ncbi:SapC family protein [Sphingomonas sp. BT-65]|uniref:SapC family protein n=1 Tax=Sphingomonas sp. BT-65 TaxID=2989821 RepID=UPI002236B685|nr:SapC family protein [Sphingomonas sp. BT-65]MCW4460662.1 SapC family protein [Sphingomonas sp. BT-65]
MTEVMTDERPQTALPPFYRDPRPLSSEAHAAWRLLEGDAGFAAEAAYVPVVASEFARSAQSYPLVFAMPGAVPVAVLGLERRNLFVRDGEWTRESYVPAYVRRYPFGFVATGEPGHFILAIDAGSGQVVETGEAGIALFEGGEPTERTRQALAFCDAYHAESEMTRAFCAALAEKDLLTERRADATLPDGRTFGLQGFQIVDPAKFDALDDATVLDWHKRGWLALVHFHLASLDRFQLLLARQAGLDPEEQDA